MSESEKSVVFVFGSNAAGRHGMGAALAAYRRHGAVYGKGVGHHGNSYAIPTKDHNMKTMKLELIETFVHDFLVYARSNRNLIFQLTPIGCGLAGYDHSQIGPMFKDAPENIIIPVEFKPYV